jgi:hypothetical protein
MFWKKKEKPSEVKESSKPEKEKPRERKPTLVITCKDMDPIEFTLIDDDKNKGVIEPWKSFYKWFFGRTHSRYFVFKCTNGRVMVMREQIISFKINT